MRILYLILAFTLNATANILLKVKAKQGLELANLNFWQIIVHNYIFLLGLFLFAINIIFYFLALRSIAISVAYPVMMIMSFIIINGYAYFFLSERIMPLQLVGYALVVAGIIMIFVFAPKTNL